MPTFSRVLITLSLMLCGAAFGQTMARVTDLNSATLSRPVPPVIGGGSPAVSPDFTPGPGGFALFVGWSSSTGYELWKSDGTNAGTVMVKDIRPGAGSAFDVALAGARFVVMGSAWYFAADDGVGGLELWKSDGTTVGTVLVRDIAAGAVASSPRDFVAYNNVLYFVATEAATGSELYSSDGTVGNAALFKDIATAAPSSSPTGFTVAAGQMFFSAANVSGVRQLFVTDGTSANTRALSSFAAPYGGVSTLVAAPTVLFFSATDDAGTEPWKVDLADAGSIARAADINPGPLGSAPAWPVLIGNRIVFAATNDAGTELWKFETSDGGGTISRVADLCAGGCSSSPAALVNAAGTIFFVATTDDAGTELWKTDATDAGAVMVADINGGADAGLSPVGPLAVLGNKVIFEGTDPTNGTEPWVSDGTLAGTLRLKDVNSGAGSGRALYPANGGTRAYFGATELTIAELWATDGTPAGTARVKSTGPTSSNPRMLTPINSTQMFFVANDGTTGDEPWMTDGTAAGTRRVVDLNAGPPSTVVDWAARVGDRVVFSATTAATGTELYGTDGTDAGLFLKDLLAGGASTAPFNFTPARDAGYFFGQSAAGPAIFRTDGTAAGTVQVAALPAAVTASAGVIGTSSYLLFSMGSSSLGEEPHAFFFGDGGITGIDVLPGTFTYSCTNYPNPSNPSNFTFMNGNAYFSALDTAGSTTRRLWQLNGTTAGSLVKVSTTATVDGPMWAAASQVFFISNGGSADTEVWRSDGTAAGTRMTKDLSPGSVGTTVYEAAVLGDKLIFSASATTGAGAELYVSDGTIGGTMLLKDIRPGDAGSFPTNLVTVGQAVYFAADDGVNGNELWSTDGTGAGTQIVPEIVSGPRGSYPGKPASAGGRLYVAAADDKEDVELYAGVGEFTPPVITATVTGTLVGQYYVDSPTVTFTVTDMESAITAQSAPCTSTTTVTVDGSTTITCTATSGGGTATKSVTIKRDTTAPVPSCADVTVEATGSSGALATFAATATDAIDPSPSVTLSPSSGSMFALGTTNVTATAKDAAGNTATCTLKVTVRDSTAPTVICPGAQTVEATSPTGTPVTYSVNAADTVDASPTITADHPSGSAFPLGTTMVVVTAKDASNNAGTCSFTVTIRDTTPPMLTCPASLAVEATSASGAMPNVAPMVADNADPNPTVALTPAAGSSYPIGTTKVTVTATDSSGNTWSCKFDVTVADTTPPALSCPAPIVLEVSSGSSMPVNYMATAKDAVDPNPSITYSRPPGSTFGIGTASVEVTARDTNYNTAKCTFTVTLNVGTGGTGGGAGGGSGTGGSGAAGGGGGGGGKGCGCSSGADFAWYALGTLSLFLGRRRRQTRRP